jgi:hypothetical protein
MDSTGATHPPHPTLRRDELPAPTGLWRRRSWVPRPLCVILTRHVTSIMKWPSAPVTRLRSAVGGASPTRTGAAGRGGVCRDAVVALQPAASARLYGAKSRIEVLDCASIIAIIIAQTTSITIE